MIGRTPEQNAFRSAKARCNNPKNGDYARYGGRGIKFLFESFEQFERELGPRPSNRHSVDRINNDGNYEPGNVRWATMKEQCVHRSTTRHLTLDGRRETVGAWAKRLGVAAIILLKRKYRGWCDQCTITIPKRGKCQHRTSTPHFQ